MKNPVLRTLALFLLPSLETAYLLNQNLPYLIARYRWDFAPRYLQSALEGAVFYAGLAFFVLVLTIEKRKLLMLRFSALGLLLNAVLLSTIQILLSHHSSPNVTAVVFCAGVFAAALSGLFVGVAPSSLFAKLSEQPRMVAWGLFAAGLYFFIELIAVRLWDRLIYSIGFLVFSAVRLTGLPIKAIPETVDGFSCLFLVHPAFGLRIFSPCSGKEGLFLFLFTFSVLKLLRVERLVRNNGLVVYGLVMMYLLNVFRITLLFFVGVWLNSRYGPGATTAQLVEYFHSNLGWVFYSAGIAGFFASVHFSDATKKSPSRSAISASIST